MEKIRAIGPTMAVVTSRLIALQGPTQPIVAAVEAEESELVATRLGSRMQKGTLVVPGLATIVSKRLRTMTIARHRKTSSLRIAKTLVGRARSLAEQQRIARLSEVLMSVRAVHAN